MLYNTHLMPANIRFISAIFFVGSVSLWIRTNPLLTVFILFAVIILSIFLYILIKPINISGLISNSNPFSDFGESLLRIEEIIQEEDARGDLSQPGRSILLHHARKVDNVIVFLHGFTSAPIQFLDLGKKFYQKGYNVFIPRQPCHGFADTSTLALQNYTAQTMVDFTNQVIDIAHGLGDRVTIVGLSGGGTMASWAGQNRGDVHQSGSIAPMLGAGFIPAALTKILTKLLLRLPNFYMWWDPAQKAANPLTKDYQYPGYPIHALGEVLRLAFAVEVGAQQSAPQADKVTIVSNANDSSVSNPRIEQLVAIWRLNGDQTTHYQFPKDLGLAHDFITLTRDGFRADIVYPTLFELFMEV
jgi:pimeloyl-ACP methyl ester carboxylesterase